MLSSLVKSETIIEYFHKHSTVQTLFPLSFLVTWKNDTLLDGQVLLSL